jgi:capsular polysaccharide biosynthesis protein
MKKYFPQYTAATYINVLPPVEKDPTRIMSPQVSKDIQYGYRVSLASLIKSQSNLQKLIDRDKIQETKWFQYFSKIKDKRILKAVRDLKKHMGAGAQRDGEFIVISMKCRNREESALIVNEMVDLFVASMSMKAFKKNWHMRKKRWIIFAETRNSQIWMSILSRTQSP